MYKIYTKYQQLIFLNHIEMLDKKQKGAGGIHFFGLEGPGVDSSTQITMSFSRLTIGVKSIFSISHKVYSKSELWFPLLGTSTSKLSKTKSSIDMVSSSNHFTCFMILGQMQYFTKICLCGCCLQNGLVGQKPNYLPSKQSLNQLFGNPLWLFSFL